MIFNQALVLQKSAALDKFFTRTLQAIVDDLSRMFPEVSQVQMIPRAWYPGGGSLLFSARLGTEPVFIKIKDKTLTVDSRLESEPDFPSAGSLANEAYFCRLLAGDPTIPRLLAFVEDDDYAYEVFESLTPFDEGMASLSAWERYQALCAVESLLRRLFAQGIVHTDVHEKNLLFRGRQVVLCDFEEARFLPQELAFEHSLDVVGENAYGNVGAFPDGHGLPGLTCLARLRQVFDPLLCAALAEQQVMVPGAAPARLLGLESGLRDVVLTRLLAELSTQFEHTLHVLDVSMELSSVPFSAAGLSLTRQLTGLCATLEQQQLATLQAYLQRLDGCRFLPMPMPGEPLAHEPVDVLLLFSSEHRLPDREAFLQAIVHQRPRAIIAEMALPRRYYPQRGDVESELRYLQALCGYQTLQLIGYSTDRGLPLCLLSDLAPLADTRLRQIMSCSEPAIRPEQAVSYPLKASIILPLAGQSPLLLQATLASLLAQSFSDFELIVVHDGSHPALITHLSDVNFPRLKLLELPDTPLSGMLARALAHASGQYWSWVNAGDQPTSRWLERLLQQLERCPMEVGVALSAYLRVNEVGAAYPLSEVLPFSRASILLGQPYPSFLCRSSLIQPLNLAAPLVPGAEASDLSWRLALHTVGQMLPEPLYSVCQCEQTHQRAFIEQQLAALAGPLDIRQVFPGIAHSEQPALARWQARIWLATALLKGASAPSAVIIDLLLAALREQYQAFVVANLVLLLAQNQAWPAAQQIVSVCLQQDDSSFMQDLAARVARQDLGGLPFTCLADEQLVFDPLAQ